MAEQEDLESNFKKYEQGKDGLSIKPCRGLNGSEYHSLEFSYRPDGRRFGRLVTSVSIRHPSGRLEQVERIEATLPLGLGKMVTTRGIDERGDKYTREVPFKDIKEFYLPDTQ